MSLFALCDNLIYLNHAAVTPWPRRAADAVQRFAEEHIDVPGNHGQTLIDGTAILKALHEDGRLMGAPLLLTDETGAGGSMR